MFDQAIQSSKAFRQGAGQMQGLLIPTLKGCPHCADDHGAGNGHVRRLRSRIESIGPHGHLTVRKRYRLTVHELWDLPDRESADPGSSARSHPPVVDAAVAWLDRHTAHVAWILWISCSR